MIVELRQKSQVTIPSELIKELGLQIGDKFDVSIKDGNLMFVPVAVYPKQYVDELKREVSKLKKSINDRTKPIYDSADDLLNDLNDEESD